MERLGPLVDVGFPTLGVFDGDDGDDDVEVLLLKTWGMRLGLLEFVCLEFIMSIGVGV